MMKDEIYNQEGARNSTNIQGKSIVVNQGLSYQDVKIIAEDIFKSNYLVLSAKAAEISIQRAEEIIDDFLKEIKERCPAAISIIENPGMQYAIFTAQKEYAKTGDKELSAMLVNILVERANQKERDLKQIVLDESLAIVSKLTLSQLDTLTLIFVLKYFRYTEIVNIYSFQKYLKEYILPFTLHLSKEQSLYQHIEYSGCAMIGKIRMSSVKIEELFVRKYRGVFRKEFTKEEFEETGISINKYPALVMKCFQDNSKFQLVMINEVDLTQLAREYGVQKSEIDSLRQLMYKYQMNTDEVKKLLENQGNFMNVLIDIWNDSQLQDVSLTSVGITLAITNLRMKTGISLDLGIWIKG